MNTSDEDEPISPRLDAALSDAFRADASDAAQVDRVIHQIAGRSPAEAIPAKARAGRWLLAAAAGLVVAGLVVWRPWADRPVAHEAPPAKTSQPPTSPEGPQPKKPKTPDVPAPAPWGTLTGRFVYAGDVPKPALLKLPENSKDVALCCTHRLVDESLVVDADSRGVANVFVYLVDDDAPVHPLAAEAVAAPARVDNVACRFTPHARAVQVGQTVTLANSDPVGHNSQVTPLGDTPCNPLIPAQNEVPHVFQRQQHTPVPITCSLHPWMKAWVLPRKSPYAVVSREDGSFELANLPAGTREFQVWHERPGALAARSEWKKGRVTISIPPGGTVDLGEIRLSPELFTR